MNKLSYILTLLIVSSICLIGSIIFQSQNVLQAKYYDDILWENNRPLSWSDFQGEPDYDNDFVKALTASSIRYVYSCQDDGYIGFNIDAVFKKSQSWVKEEAHTNYHLGHEQLHFDITELHARKLRNLLTEKNYKCDELSQFQNTITESLDKWRMEQRVYDHETFFSVKESEQSQWHFHVNQMLEEVHPMP